MAGVDELVARGWVDPEETGRHRRQRRRRADELDDRPHRAVQSRGVAAVDRRLDRMLVHRRLHRSACLVPRRAVGVEADFKARSPITYVDKITRR